MQVVTQDVGPAIVILCFGIECGGRIAIVDNLFIRAEPRRAGVVTAALAEVRAFCAGRAVRAVFVDAGRSNVPMRALYRREGFLNTERLLQALGPATLTQAGEARGSNQTASAISHPYGD